MDPDFHRGDEVAPLSFRRQPLEPESTPPQIHTPHSQFQTPSPQPSGTPPRLPDDAQPLRQPKRGRDVDPDFHRGDGVGLPRKGRGPRFSSGRRGSPPVIPAKAGIHVAPNPHSALPIPNSVPPALRDSASTPRRRSTTELAEARKGRGPRFSSGRRGSATPPPPSFRRKPESTSPQIHTSALPIPNSVPPPPSFRRKPESTPPQIHTSHSQFQTPSPPALRDSASTPRRRSTTELAEARKGRGPRFSSGRRGSPPVIPAKAGIHVPPKSTLRTPNSKLRPPSA